MPALALAREKGRRVSCISNLKNIGTALRVYRDEFDGDFPVSDNAAGVGLLVELNHIKSFRLFLCPSTKTVKEPTLVLTDAHLDYIYKGGFNERSCGPETALAADRITSANHTNYGNVLFGDGRVEAFSGPGWSAENTSHNTGGWPGDPH